MTTNAANAIAKIIRANNKAFGDRVASGDSEALARMYARGAKGGQSPQEA